MLQHEDSLIKALRAQGIEVIRGGNGFPREDQITWNTALVRKHIKNIADAQPKVLIINQGSWTLPYDSVDAATAYQRYSVDIAGVVIFSYKDT